MTQDEWRALVYILANAWPGEFTKDQEAAYFALLEDYDRETVDGALKQLAKRGGPFRPSAAEVAHAIEQHNAPLSFDEAWLVIEGSLIRHGSSSSRERDKHILEDINRRAGAIPAGWAASYGVKRLLEEPLQGDHRGAILHRLREHYDALTASDAGRRRLLEAAARPELSPGERQGLRRIEPAGLIGGGS